MKVHLLDEGYVWVPKTRDFASESSEEFGKSNGFLYAPKGNDSSYFGLFFILGVV